MEENKNNENLEDIIDKDVTATVPGFNSKYKEVYTLPRRFKYPIWIAVIALISVASYISFKVSDWGWLARSGALLVVISLTLESFGFVESHSEKIANQTGQFLGKILKMQVKRLPHIYRLSGHETEEEINDIAKKELKRRLVDVHSQMERAMLSSLRRHEFSIAAIGTLLWGFADLLNGI